MYDDVDDDDVDDDDVDHDDDDVDDDGADADDDDDYVRGIHSAAFCKKKNIYMPSTISAIAYEFLN